jgi:DNA modification methylase
MQKQLPYERVPVASLTLDPRNARKHDKKNLKAIKDSLVKFGQQRTIVVTKDNVVIAGNGTVAAAKELGWETIDITRSQLTGEDAVAYGLVDNRASELAEWDDDNLKGLLSELSESGWDIEGLGWDSEDLKGILPDEKSEGLTDEDAVPEVEQNVFGVKLGDIWQLGSHRLMCGDSTDRATVEKLMNGEKADMVFTDPPYGMNLDTDYAKSGNNPMAHNGKVGVKRKTYAPVAGDDKAFDASFILEFFADVKEIFLFGADYYLRTMPCDSSLGWSGSWFVWDKNCGESADKVMTSAFELCWSKQKHKRQILRIRSGLYGAKDDSKKRVHPTQKLVQVPTWFIDLYSKAGNLVADLFLGSGSTLIACEKTGRKCYGMEIDPHYCSVIIKRWQDFTGKEAVKI